MKKYLHKGTLSNLANLAIGAGFFFYSFHVGEGTLIGGAFHLTGCAFFCCGVHKKWCKDTCVESGCCESTENK